MTCLALQPFWPKILHPQMSSPISGAVLASAGALSTVLTVVFQPGPAPCICDCTHSDQIIEVLQSQLDRCGPETLATFVPAEPFSHRVLFAVCIALPCVLLGFVASRGSTYRTQLSYETSERIGVAELVDGAGELNLNAPRRRLPLGSTVRRLHR